MDAFFSSPGMTAVSITIAVALIASFSLMLLNIHVFRTKSVRYQALLKSLGNEDAWGTPGWFLVPLYIVSTVIASAVIVFLYVFQPHLL